MDNKITEFEKIDIRLLKPYPRNKDIYGEEDITELAESIKRNGNKLTTPIVITKRDFIISGHRRYYACLKLGMEFMPFIRKDFKDVNEELETLLLENEYREKTNCQKASEGKLWQEIEREKAKQRMSIGGKGVDNVPPLEQGKSRDIIASKVGLGSGRTYDRAKDVVDKIDKLKQEGNIQDAEFLKTLLNESIRGTEGIVKSNLVPEIPKELKEKVIKKEIPVSNAIRDIKKDLGISGSFSKKKTDSILKPIKAKTKVCTICGIEKDIDNFYEGKNKCAECFNKKNKKFKDVYGNEIKTDSSKLKGIDLNAIEADIKSIDKNINEVDYDAFVMEYQSNVNNFLFMMNHYITMEDVYKLGEIDKINQEKILISAKQVEDTMNKIKNIII